MFNSAWVATPLVTLRPLSSGRHAAWNPSTALRVAQTRSRGTMPTTMVQADRQTPSMPA